MSQIQLEISKRYDRLIEPEEATKALFKALENSGRFPISEGELSVVFVDDEFIAQLHGDFMNDPTPTDVITFLPNPEMDSAGEIVVSVDHAILRSQELNQPFSRELSLYLVHGWLHLAGYKDKTESDRAAMRVAEEEALKILEKAGAGDTFSITQQG
ncbi:MAG: rRNA maturation RNase YbeY [Verrucomicrobiota bacterium]